MMTGGCECGLVRYQLLTPPMFVNCCHCRQCQKLTGSAFALNAMIEADRVELSSGMDRVGTGSGQVRCEGCGTLLWATHPVFGEKIRFVRAGTLDEAERLVPDAHFFVRSRHLWVPIPAEVPAFETLPGEGDPPLFSREALARLEAVRSV